MPDSIFDSLQPTSSPTPPSQQDVNSLMAQATQMANEGGPGANADKAQAWLMDQMQQGGAQPKQDIFSQLPDKAAPVKTPILPGDDSAFQPDTLSHSLAVAGTGMLAGAIEYHHKTTQDVMNTFHSIQDYFKNFHANHQVIPSQPVPLEDLQAAKARGIDPMTVGNFIPDPSSPTGYSYPPRYKVNPGESLDTPAQMEQHPTVIGYLLNKSLPSNFVQSIASPHLAATKEYQEIQDTKRYLNIVKNPGSYTKDQVDQAKQILDSYKKEASLTILQKAKEAVKSIAENPVDAITSFTDPTLLAAPEAKMGTALYGARLDRVVQAANDAREVAASAEKIKAFAQANKVANKAAVIAKADRFINGYTKFADRASEQAMKLAKKQRIGNVAGSALTAGAINEAAAAVQQQQDRGFMQGKDIGAAGLVGAGLGAGLGGLHAALEGGKVNPLKATTREDVHPTQTDTALNRQGAPGDVNQPHQPGEPMPTNTPLDDTGTVPYTGGTSENLKGLHVDKNFPNTLSIKGKEIPVKDIVTQVHEAEEAPLMHPQGPVPADKLLGLVRRAGSFANDKVFSKDVLKKISEGKPLSYPDAHEIATAIENNHVQNTYGISAKDYQEAMKPYIKEIAARSEKEPKSDIPATLGNKPYEDMGHPEVVAGQGKPSVGGFVNKKLLATGLAAGGGATLAATLAPQGQKEQAAIGGGLAGLFAGMNMWGDSIPRRGFGSKERGMFAGPISRKWLPADMEMAKRMEKIGKTPEEIHAATGMTKLKDGKWVREFSDKDLQVKQLPEPGKVVPLSSAVSHLEFRKNYPDLFHELKLAVTKDPKFLGGYDNARKTIYLNPDAIAKHGESLEVTLAHEMQHAVQNVEGFPVGSNSSREGKIAKERADYLYKRNENYFQRILQWERENPNGDVNDPKLQHLEKMYQKTSAMIAQEEAASQAPYSRYERQAGEVQARTTQNRLEMTEAERRASFPHPDVPLSEQLVRYGEGTQAHELPLSDHLKATGEADEEGNLHGMTLSEDKLPQEDAIVNRAKEGDQRAISALYNKYMPRLERTLRSMMRDVGPRLGLGSEDIASQAFMKAVQALPSFEGKSSFYTWLYQIARNEALNAIDKGNRTVPTTSIFKSLPDEPGLPASQGGIEDVGGSPLKGNVEAIASTIDTPENMAVAQQVSNMVKHALSKLPAEIKEAIKMKEFTGMTEQEIADAQGVPVGTVKSRLSRGREMMGQSIKRGHGANFRKQGGFATPDQLKRLAKTGLLFGAGATAGAMLSDDHKARSAWMGGIAAVVGGEVNWRQVWPSFASLRKADPRVNVNDLLNNYDYALKAGERVKVQQQAGILKIAKSPEERVAITRAVDAGTVASLPQHLQVAAQKVKDFYNNIGKAAVARGVLPSLIDNYMNRVWVRDAAFKQYMDTLNQQIHTNMSGNTAHALLRKFTTLAQGKAAGLTPKTEDAVELMGLYSDSINQAMANKTLNEALRQYVVDPNTGATAVMPIGKAPAGYVSMVHPQLMGVRVHPSIAPSLDFLYHTYTNNAAFQLAEMLGSAIKRTNVGFSLFHTKNLIDAYLGANPLHRTPQNIVTVLKSLVGKTSLHKEYMTGGAGDIVDLALKGGVEFTPPGQHTGVEDVNTNFYSGLDSLKRFMEKTIPIKGSGLPVAAIKKLNEINDKMLWENTHAGLKLATFSNSYGQLNKAWAAELMKNPNAKIPSAEDLAGRAASFTNDVFGNLNWRRMADEATNRWTRGLALAMASPAGRRLSQVLLFAPDWTYSTVRSWTKAIGEGSGIKGLMRAKTIADLHRQYLMRSALIYLTLYNGLNVAMSGHSIWDNKDPLMVDMGNGEKLQANKHLLEVPHAMLHPKQFILNKLGPLPSEAADQVLNLDYLSPTYSPPMQGSGLEHAAKRFMPFTLQGMEYKTPEARLFSLFGMPTYGMTMENYRKLQQAKREARIRQLMKGEK